MSSPVIPVLSQTRVTPLTRIRRERLLPVRGEVVAAIGSRVDPLDVVARAAGEGRLRPVPLARYMHLTEASLDKHLLKRPGESLQAREIIASKPELFGTLRRIYRAPGAGRVASLQGTWMGIELIGEPIELKALYRGVVVNVMPRLGIIVEATGLLAQGVWGGGGEGYGVLKKMVDAPDGVLTEDKIDVSARGIVMLAGAGITETALRRAAQERAAGLIVGGLAPQLQAVVQEVGLPTVMTEGFGERPMAPPIFDLLAAHNGEEASLNTSTRRRGAAMRPEVFVPVTAADKDALDAQSRAPLTGKVDARVRLLNAPHRGALGKIVRVPELPQSLPSGISAWGAEIEKSGGARVFVPWENLELIG